MDTHLKSILRELGLPNRFEILQLLSCQPASLAHIHRITNMSVSGVSRVVNTLVSLGLIDKTDDCGYCITGIGRLILDIIRELDKILVFKDELIDTHEFMEVVPPEFKLGLANLTKAEVEYDIYVAIKRAVDEVSNAKSWCKCICRVMECSIFRILVRNYLRGVKDKMISSTDTLKDRIELLIQAAKAEKLSEEEIKKIKDNIEIRVLDLPFQLGIVDGKIAFFQILKPDRVSPAFISTDREFVDWTNRLFDYFWNMAKPVKIPFEKVLED